MNTDAKPPPQEQPDSLVDQGAALVSPDGTWEWNGSAWVPRGGDAAWLGRFLGFSKQELDANRAGRLTFGQDAGLWLSAAAWTGIGVLLVGLSVAVTLPESFWSRVAAAPIVFTLAVYFCWRAVAAVVDATRGGVAVTSGTLQRRWESDDDAPWPGAGYYYVGVSGIEKKLYKHAGENVPVGMYCRAYYAYGSHTLLSVELAPSVDAYAFVPSSTAWARVRRTGIAGLVGAFMLIFGVYYLAKGDAADRIDSSVAGIVALLLGSVLLSISFWRLLPKGRPGS